MKHCKPNLMLSGINKGRNVGEDMTYSGTIAAAMEATLLGIPAIALSQDMNEEDHRDFGVNGIKSYSAAQCYAAQIIKKLMQLVWPKDVLINVNFPAALSTEVQGMEVTRRGRNKLGDEIIEHKDPRDEPYYWIGARRSISSNSSGTDINAVDRNVISITPISMDMTHKPTIKILEGVFGRN
jgi:5'-nucleotidase